jgi:hypothetical protein
MMLSGIVMVRYGIGRDNPVTGRNRYGSASPAPDQWEVLPWLPEWLDRSSPYIDLASFSRSVEAS